MTTTHESLTPLPREASLPAVPSRSAARPLSRRALRKVLNRALGLPSQLDAFFVDFYPDVYSKTALGMDREAKLNLLLSYVPEVQLTQTLRQEYPQETAQIELGSELASSSLSDERRTRYTVVLLATISDMDVHKVYALLNHLRKYTADSELTIEEVRSGSVVLACAGSEHGFIRLYTDYRAGQLNELLGYRVKDVKLGYGESLSSVIAHLEPPGTQSLFLAQSQVPTLSTAKAGQILPALAGLPVIAAARSVPAVTLRTLSTPGLVTEALRGDKQRVTAELTGKHGYPWRQVLWSLGTAACVALVALLGDGGRGSLSSGPGPEYGSADRPGSLSAPSRSEPELGPPDEPEKPALSPAHRGHFPKVDRVFAPPLSVDAPPTRRPAPQRSPPSSGGRFGRSAVAVHCVDSGRCPKAATQHVVRSCLSRYLPDAAAGKLALQRVGATYAVARRPRGAGGAAHAALVGCIQSHVAELYGSDPTGWPTELHVTLSGPASAPSDRTPSRTPG